MIFKFIYVFINPKVDESQEILDYLLILQIPLANV